MISRIVENLQSPECYPHPVVEPIRLIETHISFVLLTGQFVYKLKKPVDLGFLDFSTLEKRRHYCEEEVRLNRRFGSNLYVGVVPIFQTGEAISLTAPDGDAEPIEFAVQMRQFDQHDLLLEVFRRGELTRKDAVAIASKLVQVHSEAATGESIAPFGSPDSVRDMIQVDLDSVRPFIGETIAPELFQTIEEGFFGLHDRYRDLLAARVTEGCTRECHGDLHLNNMCRHDGAVQFFDCIEFNEQFRNIDVMYELAFPVMDLDYRGGSDLANVLMNRYVEESGDYEGACLLPFYIALRAWVRGKVATLRYADKELAPDIREEARQSADKHFRYAAQRLQRDGARLIIVCGLSGTGKTTVARELAEQIGAVHVRSDAVRKHLHGVPLHEEAERAYTEAATAATYDRLLVLAAELLDAGWTVILDATFRVRVYRERAQAIAASSGAGFRIVHLTAPLDVLRQRIAAREGDVSDARPSLLEEQAAAFENFGDAELDCVVEVNTENADYSDKLNAKLLTAEIRGEP